MTREMVRDALQALGVRRLMLAVHESALPADARDDLGRGAPLSLGGLAFLEFAAQLGFHGLQLGPQGETSDHDPSPYDSTIFARSTLLAAGPLAAAGFVSEATFAEAVARRPPASGLRAAHRHVHAVSRRLLEEAFSRRPPETAERLRGFTAANADWLERDGLYAALAAEHAEPDWLRWPEEDRQLWERIPGAERAQEARRARIASKHAELIERHRFAQLLAHEQHAAFQAQARRLGMLLSGDVQIGVSHREVWSWGSLFLSPWRMGAPPSRTNPEGQPWNYAVLDPALYGSSERPGPALALLRLRVGKLLGEFDGLRIDHPHGLIDPWVYPGGQADPQLAVQQGARLFSSPDVPELADLAIATREQIDFGQPRHADGWVRDLTVDQVVRYAVLFDELVAAARQQGREVSDLVCEVLSTQPHPVGRVLARHGLGRFRVTQKAALDDPRDVYRSENAAPQDWIMVGTHDTEPIWRVAERWQAEGTAPAQAAYLAGRLAPRGADRARWAAAVASDPARLAQARLAELFLGPARNVMIFFTDLLGMREVYNRPGTIAEENWSLRIPPDFRARHAEDARRGRALDLPRVLAMALRARGLRPDLLRALEQAAGPDPSR